jgi:hypothetical protein
MRVVLNYPIRTNVITRIIRRGEQKDHGKGLPCDEGSKAGDEVTTDPGTL